MIPLLNELGRKYAGGVKVAKLNTYDNQRIVTEYEIKKTPTLLFFKHGKLVHRMEGEKTKEDLEKSIQTIIREIVDEPT
jgi:thioredoxin 1